METADLLLLLLLLSHASADVPPVTNVNLECRNFHNILRWNYSNDSLKPDKFRVEVHYLEGKFKTLWVDYPTLQSDLSYFSMPDNEYYAIVVALAGPNESLPVPPDGLSFSYYSGCIGCNVACLLDLPPVNVTAQSEVGIKYQFTNPSVVYRQTNLKRQTSMFTYKVAVNNKTYTKTCRTDVCEDSISAGLLQDIQCLRINGKWQGINVYGTHDYCAQPNMSVVSPTTSYLPLYIALGVFAVVVCAVLLSVHFYRKISHFSTPHTLNFSNGRQVSMETSSKAPLIHSPSVSPPVCTEPTWPMTPDDDAAGAGDTGRGSTSDGPKQPAVGVGNGTREVRECAQEVGEGAPGVGDGAPGVREGAPGVGEGAPGVGEGAQEGHAAYEQRDRLVTMAVEIAPDDTVDAYRS